jgi:hypothetical protein
MRKLRSDWNGGRQSADLIQGIAPVSCSKDDGAQEDVL